VKKCNKPYFRVSHNFLIKRADSNVFISVLKSIEFRKFQEQFNENQPHNNCYCLVKYVNFTKFQC